MSSLHSPIEKSELDTPKEEQPFLLFRDQKLTQISHSMINAGKSCWQKGGFRYVLGLKSDKDKRYFALGDGFDQGTEAGFRAAWKRKKITPSAMVDIAVAAYEERCNGSKEIDWGKGVKREDAMAEDRDKISRGLPAYWDKLGKGVVVAEEFEPQSEATVTLPSGLNVVVIFDVIAVVPGGLKTIDVKTSASAWKEEKAQEEGQSDIQPWALSQLTRKPIVGHEFHVTVPNKVKPNVERFEVPIRHDRIRKLPMLLNTYADMYSDVFKRGGTAPPNVSQWTCGLCDYRKECEAKYGGKRPTFAKDR